MRMKPYLLIIGVFLSIQSYSQTPEKTVNSFFEALNTKNASQLEALMADDLKLHSLNISAEFQLKASDKDTFLNSIKSIGPEVKIEERIFDVQTLENEHIATVWVPYEFYVNGNFSHNGVNVFTLLRLDQQWKITSIADTRIRKKG